MEVSEKPHASCEIVPAQTGTNGGPPHGSQTTRVLCACRRNGQLHPGGPGAGCRTARAVPAGAPAGGNCARTCCCAMAGALAHRRRQAAAEHARGILHQVERAREELGRVGGALAGRVAIGLPPSLSRALSVPIMRAVRQQLPQASVSICEGLSTNMQEWLTAGRLDMAVSTTPSRLHRSSYRRCWRKTCSWCSCVHPAQHRAPRQTPSHWPTFLAFHW